MYFVMLDCPSSSRLGNIEFSMGLVICIA
jgi:hypothetical protein